MMVWFVCSANPFYLGLTRVDVYFSMSWFLHILLKYLRNKLPATLWPKRLDFILEMKFYKCLKFLEPLKTFSLWFQHIQSYFHREIIDEGHEIHCLTHGYGSHGATHVGMYNFQRFGRSPPPPLVYSQFYIVCLQCTLHKATKMLGQNIVKAHTSHCLLEHINTLHIQKSKAPLSKLKRVITHWTLHQVGHFRFVNLYKLISYKLPSRGTIAMASPSQNFTMHSFRLVHYNATREDGSHWRLLGKRQYNIVRICAPRALGKKNMRSHWGACPDVINGELL